MLACSTELPTGQWWCKLCRTCASCGGSSNSGDGVDKDESGATCDSMIYEVHTCALCGVISLCDPFHI